MKKSVTGKIAALLIGTMLSAGTALADGGTLRIAMTSSDVPVTTGMPNNGFEGMRFLGYPVFEPLVDWDLSSADKPADIRPGLAESWEIDPEDTKRWIFHLRPDVEFHDGSAFDADAVVWNLERFFDETSPQFDQAGSAIVRGRNPILDSWEKIDDMTVAITTKYPASYFPYIMSYMLIASPAAFETANSDWNEYGKAPSGTGPFKVTNVTPRVSVELSRNDDYWNPDRIAKLDHIQLFPMPEPTTRLAALRSGQVDWIEVPPPDAIPGLEGAGFNVVTNTYPHVWPWEFDTTEGSPFADVRVRQAANYAVNREGIVALMNGTAAPAKGFFDVDSPLFGSPENDYTYDPEKARALLAEAGYGPDNPVHAKILTSTSGSGQMLPVQMNEYLQQTMAESGFDIDLEMTEWGSLLVALRNPPGTAPTMDADALNISFASSDISYLAKYFHSKNASPVSQNWGAFGTPETDALLDQIETTFDAEKQAELTAELHAKIVDQAPWLFIVHDLNPRAMSEHVKGFVSAQSWFQDLTSVYIEE
ncbi:ABC transporter substrate-binding protein [Falsirhodobacter sp. alg1]|uniref:ABC transporter substrate-binding protein n=1 Tax=Falsirhodobacter sp. alg1 TaxID=1472418 RepID=UPI0005EFC512|nr:ABC transporter substrate-binding protein [Falsirhodobacter sp. alg1]